MDETQLALLRLYIADPAGNNEYLHDDKLQALSSNNDGDLYATAADAWRMKAANVADWYLANIDGAFLSRDQVWEHCMKMAEHFEKAGGGALVNVSMDSGFQTSAEEPEF
jgi:hypothetical protein